MTGKNCSYFFDGVCLIDLVKPWQHLGPGIRNIGSNRLKIIRRCEENMREGVATHVRSGEVPISYQH